MSGPIGAPLRRWMVLVALLGAAALLAVNEWNIHRATESLRNNDSLLSARIEVRRLQLFMLGAETAQRGYVITGNADEATQFRQLATALDEQLQLLRQKFASSPDRQVALLEIESLTEKRLSVMRGIAGLMDEGRPAAAMELARSGLGNEHLAQLEALIGGVADAERERQAANRKALVDTLQINRFAIIGLLAISMLSIALHMRRTARLADERARQAAALQNERDRLDGEVTRRTQDLREIAQHLQSAREDERSHLARELHDELGGLLTAAKLDVARLRNKLREAPEEVLVRLKHLVVTLDAGIALKRRIIEDLRPSTLSNLGLQPALQILCGEFRQRSELEVETDLATMKLSPDAEITLFRVLQESLTNISKYAQASRVRVNLQQHEGQAVLSIEDDGQGFDVRTVALHARGLAGMRFRLESCAGSLEVQSRPGRGTLVLARVPAVSADTGMALETS